MRFFSFALVLLVAGTFGGLGCAQGGGRDRGGGGGMDASQRDGATGDAEPGVDSGGGDLDGGGGDLDGGGGDLDSGGGDLDSGGSDPDTGPPPPRDSGPPDTGPPDTGPPPGCGSAAECADGRMCNGIERCIGRVCSPGTAMVCDDGIACTRDGCAEPGTCTFTPDDTLCPGGGRCSASAGCTAMCAETPCRLVSPQCGCGAGQGCYIDGFGTRSCQISGTSAEGATCTSITSCSPGNLCVNIAASGPAANICKHFCNADTDCTGAGSLCTGELGDGMGGTLPGIRICSRACDPVAQTGCATGACGIFVETVGAMRYLTDCYAPFGAGGQGSACVDDSGCQRGYACLDPDGPGIRGNQCLHWCRNPGLAGIGCLAGDTCFGFMPAITLGGTTYGICD